MDKFVSPLQVFFSFLFLFSFLVFELFLSSEIWNGCQGSKGCLSTTLQPPTTPLFFFERFSFFLSFSFF